MVDPPAIEMLLRHAIERTAFDVLKSVAIMDERGPIEPYIGNGWGSVGPLEFEIPRFKVNIGIVVERA